MEIDYESLSNAELATLAETTRDCGVQVELAEHTSQIIRIHLIRNNALCSEALEALGDELGKLRALAAENIQRVQRR